MISYNLVIEEIIQRAWKILTVPKNNPNLIPTVIPLVIGVLIIELYFGRYEKEELGWNSAVANSTLLIAVASIIIYESVFEKTITESNIMIALGILVLGLLLLTLDFFHIWPRKIAFGVSSALFIYYIVYLAIAFSYGEIPFNRLSVISSVLIFLIVLACFKWIENVIKPVEKRTKQKKKKCNKLRIYTNQSF